jgi:hypothetical protein
MMCTFLYTCVSALCDPCAPSLCRTEDKGDHYLVNGQKKFITSGVKADFFVVAVRTGDQGMFGISLLLLEKGMPGLHARRMKTQVGKFDHDRVCPTPHEHTRVTIQTHTTHDYHAILHL